MDLFGANDYTMEDLVWYTGLFGGIILVHQGLQGVVDHNLIRLLIGGCVGIGLGWGMTLVYRSLKAADAEGGKE